MKDFAIPGMRQLHEEKMNDAVRFIDRLMRNQSFNPFSYKSSTNSRILSGEEEGVFAWITVNYLLGSFTGEYHRRFLELTMSRAASGQGKSFKGLHRPR
jgi:Golgi nucleoside diphosphatase